MPEPGPSTPARARPVLAWAGIAVAFALGLRPPLLVAAGKVELPRNDISSEEGAFAGIGRADPDARIGWLLPRDALPGIARMILISRYALLPRRLTVVTVPQCTQAGHAACGVDDIAVAIIPHFLEYSGVADATGLGFEINSDADRVIVIGVRRR